MAHQHPPVRHGVASNTFHIPGFEFRTNEDPMLSPNPIANTLLQRVFMPNKTNAAQDFRHWVNLRIILEAVCHLSRFWGHKDFWFKIRHLLDQFSVIIRAHHFEDIVNVYCTARQDGCTGDRYKNIGPPNRIAELADKINSLRPCDSSDVFESDWDKSFHSWKHKLCDVFFDLGIHFKQFNNGTCAPELLGRPLDSRITAQSVSGGMRIRGLSLKIEETPTSDSRLEDQHRTPQSASTNVFIKQDSEDPPSSLKRPYNDNDGSAAPSSKRPALDKGQKGQISSRTRAVESRQAPPGNCRSSQGKEQDQETDGSSTKTTGVVTAEESRADSAQPSSDLVTKGLPSESRALSVTSTDNARKASAASDGPPHATAKPPHESQALTENQNRTTDDSQVISITPSQLETESARHSGQGSSGNIQSLDPVQDLLYSLERRQMRLEQIESTMRDWQQKLDQRASSDQAYIQKLETKVNELQDRILAYEKDSAEKSCCLEEAVKRQEELLGLQKTRVDGLKIIIESQKDDENQLVIIASNTKRLETIESQVKTLQSQQSFDNDRISVLDAFSDGIETKFGDLETRFDAIKNMATKRTADLDRAVKSMRDAQDEEWRLEKQKVEDLKRDLFETVRQEHNVSGYRLENVEISLRELKEYKQASQTRTDSLEKDLSQAKRRLDKQAPLDRLELLEKDANQIVKELNGKATVDHVMTLEEDLERVKSHQAPTSQTQLGTGNVDIETQICDLREYIDHSTGIYQKRLQALQGQLNTMQQAQPPLMQIDTTAVTRLDAFQRQLDQLQEQLDKNNGESRKQPLSPSVSDLDSVLASGCPYDKVSHEGAIGDLAKTQKDMPAKSRRMNDSGRQ